MTSDEGLNLLAVTILGTGDTFHSCTFEFVDLHLWVETEIKYLDERVAKDISFTFPWDLSRTRHDCSGLLLFFLILGIALHKYYSLVEGSFLNLIRSFKHLKIKLN